jgi:SAM-dependent methyltransferase
MKTAHRSIGELSADEIRELVRDKYSEVAFNPGAKYRFRVGHQYALDVGYPEEETEGLPKTLTESFTGVSSCLVLIQEFKPGEIVLELGSGGGLDTALLARKVGPSGKVIGVDLSLAMLQRATTGSKQAGISRAHFSQALAEELPIASSSVDWVVSNGIFNLSPEKQRILEEIHRVLKPRGRVFCSEIVLQRDPSAEERLNEDDWFK